MGVYGPTTNVSRIFGNGGTPSVARGSGLPADSTITVEGDNDKCMITIVTGTGLTTGGNLFTLTLADNVSSPSVLRPSFSAYNLNSASMTTSVFVDPTQSTKNTFTVKCGSVNLAAATTLAITCHIQ